MSLYDGPRDVSKHLAELEARWGGPGYDHLNGGLHGWRAERHLMEVRHDDAPSNHPRRAPGMLRKLLTRSLALLGAIGGYPAKHRTTTAT